MPCVLNCGCTCNLCTPEQHVGRDTKLFGKHQVYCLSGARGTSMQERADAFRHTEPEEWWEYLWCFNTMTEDQQRFLVTQGYRPIGEVPFQGPCREKATVGVEVKTDHFPGPRFYCTPCAIAYLQTLVTDTGVSQHV